MNGVYKPLITNLITNAMVNANVTLNVINFLFLLKTLSPAFAARV